MRDHTIQRVIWKEYRTQRSVWLSLLGGAFLIQLLYLFFTQQSQDALSEYPFAVAAVLGVCYAMTCAAILFAGEREEETDQLLQTFPVHPARLLIGKLSFGVVSLAGFTVIGLLTSLLTIWLAGRDPYPVWLQSTSKSAENWVGYALNGFIVATTVGFCATLVVSLLVNRVMAALLGGLAFMLLIVYFLNDTASTLKVDSAAMCLAVNVVLLTLCAVLTPRWLIGQSLLRDAWRWRETIREENSTQVNQLRQRFLLSLLATCGGGAAQLIVNPAWSQHVDAYSGMILLQVVALLVLCGVAWLVPRPVLALAIVFAGTFLLLGQTMLLVLAVVVGVMLLVPNRALGFVFTSLLAIGLLVILTPWVNWRMMLPVRVMELLFVAGVIAGDFALARRWAQNQPLIWGGVPLFEESEQVAARFRAGRTLRWVASRSTPSGRMFGVLIWKELRTAVPILIGGLTILVIGWLSISAMASDNRTAFRDFGSVASVILMGSLWLTPIICGQLAFSSDHRHQRMRFLADHAVSPGLVWLTKQLVWGGSATLLGYAYTILLFKAVLRETPPLGAVAYEHPHGEIWLSLLFVLAGFAVTQLISMWCSRTILSICLSVTTVSLLLAALQGSVAYSVPLWMSLGIVGAGGLAASYFTLEGTLKRTRSWQAILTKIGWVAIPLCVALLTVARWRVVQIPKVNPGFDWKLHAQMMAAPDVKWSERWRKLISDSQQSAAYRAAMGTSPAETIREMTDRMLERNPPRLDPAVAIDVYGMKNLIDVYYREQIQEPFLQDTLSREQEWKNLRAGMALTSYLSTQAVNAFEYDMLAQARLRMNAWLRHWAQAPGQSAESLRQAHRELPPIPLRNEMPKNYYVMMRQTYEQQGAIWQRIQAARKDEETSPGILETLPFSILLTPEIWRAKRLLNLESNLENSPQPILIDNPEMPSGSFTSVVGYWERTTPLFKQNSAYLDFDIAGLPADQQATELILMLERYKLQHGEYPATLERLLDTENQEQFPLNLGELHYQPQGYSLPLVLSASQVIPAGQPVLWRSPAGQGLVTRTTLNKTLGSYGVFEKERLQETGKTRLLMPFGSLSPVNLRDINSLQQQFQFMQLQTRFLDTAAPIQYGVSHGQAAQLLTTVAELPEKTSEIAYGVVGQEPTLAQSGHSD